MMTCPYKQIWVSAWSTNLKCFIGLIQCYMGGGVGAVMSGCRRRVGAKIAGNKKKPLILPSLWTSFSGDAVECLAWSLKRIKQMWRWSALGWVPTTKWRQCIYQWHWCLVGGPFFSLRFFIGARRLSVHVRTWFYTGKTVVVVMNSECMEILIFGRGFLQEHAQGCHHTWLKPLLFQTCRENSH
jgi:hypothetical protein